MPVNVEIKARTTRKDKLRQLLLEWGADFRGLDHQVDTYFRVQDGRLKLREGNIEHSLIFYKRPDQEGPKQSDVFLYHPAQRDAALSQVLGAALGVWKVVDKRREIFFLDNVKFHLDEVEGLGSFVEIEAIDNDGSRNSGQLLEQCQHYLQALGIREEDLCAESYSDMIPGREE